MCDTRANGPGSGRCRAGAEHYIEQGALLGSALVVRRIERNRTVIDSWNQFLRAQGAVHANDHVRDFGDPATERRAVRDANVLVDLAHFALIRVSGPDSTTFLNGQLTNDVDHVDVSHTQLSAWCSPKGRMLALFRVIRHDDSFLLQLPTATRENVMQRLRTYVLRSKVVLANADDTLVRFGVAGPNADVSLRDTLGIAPTEPNGVSTSDGILCMRLPGIQPRFEVVASPDQAPRLWNELKRVALPAGAAVWDWHDIMAGIPSVQPATSDAFVPQMANLDLLNGISFDKGCYTGQEIVARLHYRGRLKQRMYRAHVATARTPIPGDRIFAPDMPDQATGTVVVAAASPNDGYDLLAVIHCDSVAAGELHLHQANGSRLTIEPLPYSVPN
jgi:tRNA-modifying protein YgfZ